ncbi:hypothetical protein ASG56_01235 [Rhodococcus sp. Leaf7]|nr:hypothetical protein ASG56_01235 [Rhodococcus sp. Leaf7]KQU41868.1 hypothetical protein ASG64_01235 [Rhodococcus sp. Leaf247]
MAFAFTRSSDFPVDKNAGDPCPNLSTSFSCTVHDSLDSRGFRGCSAFDCFGAGQHVSSRLSGGRTWRDDPSTAASMFAAFRTVTALHELLWHLTHARHRTYDDDLKAAVDVLVSEITASVDSADPAADLEMYRERVRPILDAVSEDVRASFRAQGDLVDPILVRYADLAGRDLRRLRTVGADLRGASLLSSDLRGVDMAGCDLLGADLRGADVRGADLTDCLFLTRTQLGSARADQRTRLPKWSA